ncbi:hypothetical protein DCD74_11125 [Lysobacter oculi]|uniref:Uncharacterized protein n=1 Tax=Solilutibacter oculi TaxID=2698682 RepID=A0A344J7Z8_9GAMM|nr:hypothetical protein DCD74_11125 [Lysobacter oculi]
MPVIGAGQGFGARQGLAAGGGRPSQHRPQFDIAQPRQRLQQHQRAQAGRQARQAVQRRGQGRQRAGGERGRIQ